LAIWLGVAVLVAAAVAPAEARKRKPAEKPVEESIPDLANGEPMTLVISLSHQKVDVYRGTIHITSSQVSTGMPGYASKAGVFSILEKKRHHHSNIYSGAPMPWMQRVTWSGTALHGGVVPGYPASHGCIRLPFSFAPKLFQITTVGEHVVVAWDRLTPKLVEHANLFQPLPPPAPPAVAIQEQAPQRQSSNSTQLFPTESPASQVEQVHAIDATANEDMRIHAIDPSVGVPEDRAVVELPDDAPLDHAVIDPPDNAPGEHAAVEPSSRGTDSHAFGGDYTAASDPAPISVATASTTSDPATAAVEPISVVLPVATSAPGPSLPESTPPAPPAPPALSATTSIVVIKLGAGTKAAGIEAAEPRSNRPLRILVTRRTQRDRIKAVQYLLSSMGYLAPQNFDGTLGKATATAIKAFQKANGMPETGAFTDDFVKKVYEVSGNGEPPMGHLFVRQEFGRIFDVPVSFRNPEQPLGTHLFTAMKFAPGDTKARWMAVSLQGDDSAATLDRLEIPNDVRRKISERLTPGSSLIIGDTAINSAALPKGGDFLVWAKDTQGNDEKPIANAKQAKAKQAKAKQAKAKQAKAKQAKAKQAKAKQAKATQGKATFAVMEPWRQQKWQRTPRR
jgi:peptidoglycan hydrolase-like protein with peptidoglycan-binding domain